MGLAVFAHANRIVGENVDVRKERERAEANGRAAIIGEDKKRCARRAKDSVIGNAVHDRAHAVLANTKMDVATAGIVPREIAAVLDVIQGRSMQVGTAADK